MENICIILCYCNLQVAGYITPVPGGVGPMTVAMLMHNTVQSAVTAYNKWVHMDYNGGKKLFLSDNVNVSEHRTQPGAFPC